MFLRAFCMHISSLICISINALWIMAVIKMMNYLGGFFLQKKKKSKGRLSLDMISLRDTAAGIDVGSSNFARCFSLLSSSCLVLLCF